jgi:hypothetical protein
MLTDFSRDTKAEGRKIGAKFIFKKHDLRNSLSSKQGNALGFFFKQNSELLDVTEGGRAVS